MNKTKLQSAIAAFIKSKKANVAYHDDNWAERKERKAYYQSFTKDKLLAMSEDAFFGTSAGFGRCSCGATRSL